MAVLLTAGVSFLVGCKKLRHWRPVLTPPQVRLHDRDTRIRRPQVADHEGRQPAQPYCDGGHCRLRVWQGRLGNSEGQLWSDRASQCLVRVVGRFICCLGSSVVIQHSAPGHLRGHASPFICKQHSARVSQTKVASDSLAPPLKPPCARKNAGLAHWSYRTKCFCCRNHLPRCCCTHRFHLWFEAAGRKSAGLHY